MVEEGGKDGGVLGGGQGSPQLARTGGESLLVSGRWRKNWIKNMLPYPRRGVCKDDSNKKKADALYPSLWVVRENGLLLYCHIPNGMNAKMIKKTAIL